VVVAGAYVYLMFLMPEPELPRPPRPPAAKPAAPKAATPATKAPPPAAPAGTPAPAAPATPPPATPSATLNDLAQAPAAAVNKAKDAVAARETAGQSRVEPVLAPDLANKPAAERKAVSAVNAVTQQGVSATAALEVANEAGAAFRAFIAGAKIPSVIGGSAGGPAAKATINGRVVRAGDSVDAGLGIVLESIDVTQRQLVFRDKTGAIVVRRY
jgi:hypothetical protein